MDKIKVAHIITQLELGGAQQVAIHTAKHLDRSRFESIFIRGKGGILDDEIKNSFIVPYLVPTLRREVNISTLLNDLRAFREIKKILKKAKVDIVHTHSSKAGILGRRAARRAKVPVIIHTYHGFGFNEGQKPFVRWVYVLVERRTAKITNKFIAVAKENLERGLNNEIGTKEKYTVIHAGIKIKEFTKPVIDISEKKKDLGINPETPVVGMIACFKPQKAPVDFVLMAKKVAEIFPDVKFVLVGDGELKDEIEKTRDKLNLGNQLILTGWLTDDTKVKVNEIIHIFDVMVLTSLWEGLPCVFPQAMAASKPIVATDVGGAKEVIEDGVNGFLISPHDPKKIEKMAEKVIELLKNKEMAKRMGIAGKNKLKPDFDIDQMVKDIEKLYEKLYANIQKR